MSERLTVILSGCHSGPNPSPGLGIAQSLRLAYPLARLIARDFSEGATGIHHPVFDEVWICPPWDEADLDLLRRQLLSRLEGAWLLSGLDVEIRWLAGLDHPRILCPPAPALAETAKPELRTVRDLGVPVPDWLPVSAGERALHRFGRRHDWQVWVKGSVHEARAAHSWTEVQQALRDLGSTWGEAELFVQAHVAGTEESLAFAAYRGELLDAVWLEKRMVTEQGKVWGGAVGSVPVELHEALRSVLRDLRWTGGGELEFICDREGELWLLEWNPRFPAWIHGATLSGVNLPGLLLERASGEPAVPARPESDRFVRIVTEVPVRAGMSLPRPSASAGGEGAAWKHPSGMPQLSRRLGRPRATPELPAEPLPETLVTDLLDAARTVTATPARVLLRRTAEARFVLAARLREKDRIQVAYSLKTNPDPAVLAIAHSHGLWAETISRAEVDWAKRCGWSPGEILYNGPVPLDPGAGESGLLAAVFADDAEAFGRYLHSPPARVVGVRLRPPFVESRFGVSLGEPEEVRGLTSLFAEAPPGPALGVSFHLASSEIGTGRWESLARTVVDFAGLMQELAGRSLAVVDLGGGWTPEDFDLALEGTLPQLQAEIATRVGEGVSLILEPGKALIEAAGAVLARVVDIRELPDAGRAAVLDCGLCDLPHIASYPHRVALIRGGTATLLGQGADALWGRLCMEADRLAEGIALPADLAVGDLFVFLDAGAYDASMAFAFGRGGAAERDFNR